jgi:hypothetical protein
MANSAIPLMRIGKIIDFIELIDHQIEILGEVLRFLNYLFTLFRNPLSNIFFESVFFRLILRDL